MKFSIPSIRNPTGAQRDRRRTCTRVWTMQKSAGQHRFASVLFFSPVSRTSYRLASARRSRRSRSRRPRRKPSPVKTLSSLPPPFVCAAVLTSFSRPSTLFRLLLPSLSLLLLASPIFILRFSYARRFSVSDRAIFIVSEISGSNFRTNLNRVRRKCIRCTISPTKSAALIKFHSQNTPNTKLQIPTLLYKAKPRRTRPNSSQSFLHPGIK